MSHIITTHIFNPEFHYEIVSAWWKKQNWPVIPLSHLPRLGIFVYCDDVPAAVGWVFQTDSAFCWFEFIVANPEIRKEKRKECLSHLINEAKSAAKDMGFQSIFMTVTNESLIARLKSHGFEVVDTGVSNIMFNIQRSL